MLNNSLIVFECNTIHITSVSFKCIILQYFITNIETNFKYQVVVLFGFKSFKQTLSICKWML